MLYRESFFITGFPGFIASRLVEQLVGPERQMFLLVERKFVELAMEEIEQIAEATATPLDNFVIVEGDITLPKLGISDADLQVIQIETTDVFHLAAAYDLAVAKDIAFNVNLLGTRHVNDLACSIKNLRRISLCLDLLRCRKTDGTDSRNRTGTQRRFSQLLRGNKISRRARSRKIKKPLAGDDISSVGRRRGFADRRNRKVRRHISFDPLFTNGAFPAARRKRRQQRRAAQSRARRFCRRCDCNFGIR